MKLLNFRKNNDLIDALPEDTTPNIKYFFKLLWRKLTKLVSINLLAILQFVPIFAALAVYFWADTTPVITNTAYPIMQGISDFESATPADMMMLFTSSIQSNELYITPFIMSIVAVLILIFALTFGLWNVGLAYLMRETVIGNPVFIFSDMKHAIKRNFKQGILFGILDLILLVILYVDFTYLGGLPSSFYADFMYVAIIAISVIYLLMRFYLYLMLITFDIKITKLFKNALIFVVLGLKRSLLAVVWIIIMIFINILIFMLIPPLGIIFPILYMPAFPLFTTTYAAYPTIKQYMIDPVPQNSVEDEE